MNGGIAIDENTVCTIPNDLAEGELLDTIHDYIEGCVMQFSDSGTVELWDDKIDFILDDGRTVASITSGERRGGMPTSNTYIYDPYGDVRWNTAWAVPTASATAYISADMWNSNNLYFDIGTQNSFPDWSIREEQRPRASPAKRKDPEPCSERELEDFLTQE